MAYWTDTKWRTPELVYFFFLFFSSGFIRSRLNTCPPLNKREREREREGKGRGVKEGGGERSIG